EVLSAPQRCGGWTCGPRTSSVLVTAILTSSTGACRWRSSRALRIAAGRNARMTAVLFRLAYPGVTNALAMLRLLPMSDRDKDAEIPALRHQIMVLQRQLHGEKVRFTAADRAVLAAPLHRLPPGAAPSAAAGTPRNRIALAPRLDR